MKPDMDRLKTQALTVNTATQVQVLLVDDEPRMLSSLYELIKDEGYALHTATNGSEAIALLREGRYDLVILDWHLPDMDGHVVMDFMITLQTTANVIVTSGARGIDAVIGALQRGAYDYLRKPYAREELLKTVNNALQQRRLTAENQLIAWRLANSEKVYRYLVNSSPDIIYTLDNSGCFSFINDRVQPLLGYKREELIGQHYSVLVDENDMERAHYVFNEVRGNARLSRTIELRLKSSHANTPVRTFCHELIVLTHEGNGLATDAIHREVSGTYVVARDITERKRADDLIAFQAYHDTLTALPNRLLFRDRLGLAILQAKRNATHLAVMFLDLDRFKLVNDTLGHVIGDALLQEVAVRLKGCLRSCDTLSRLGGDEFTAVLPELNNRQDAELIADKFLTSLRYPFELVGQPVHISVSIGIAVYPHDGESVDELIKNSDMAMYHMKAQGKNGHAFFDRSMQDSSSHKIALEHSLHLALAQGELEMYYQPQIDLKTRKVIGAEALMRWNHPERGLLSAGEFLPFAEENGLMLPLSDWMMEAICTDLLEWNSVGGLPIRMSFNVSPQYLDRGDFFEKFTQALHRYNIRPEQIEIEITENISIRNPQVAIEQLAKLCQLGVSVAIDDFGIGYSSLSYLHRFPIHTIKIDRSFVMGISDGKVQSPVILAIISIAKGLRLNLIAEGVETSTQLRYLEEAGCQTIQGYYFHKPMPQKSLLALLCDQSRLA